ncbi:relaxase/mobilization nuclease domain-containing protein [Arthrobacter sp. ERGS1:01]|uniref:relaxase/mobilization nuclease domain-containing protein n=1 Tax=Arthrobacter sp. ERGS1:01 TaxID=1704044 RepID=UPI0006B62B0A|nr:hypothetical protein [Arthrobacter sp. ERGS1:01]
MIPNVVTGNRMQGLIRYLAGPGKVNEHTDIHLVCASDQIVSVLDGQALTGEAVALLGQEMNFPKSAFRPGELARDHVLHVSLALDPSQLGEAGVRDDEFWEKVSRRFIAQMSLDGADGKSPNRWVAIRHGVSTNGNDHVHLAVSMIREDGTWWSDYKSKFRSQQAARVIEKEFGLRILGQGVKTKGYAPGELLSVARRRAEAKYVQEAKLNPLQVPWKLLDSTARQHLIAEQSKIEQPRFELARFIRASGAGAQSEGEYVRRLRGNGLLVRPYYAKGSTEQVAGYSVALKPVHGERPIWYGGGTLAKDLSLPSLRAGWSESDAALALPEWKAAAKNRAFAAPDDGAVSSVELGAYFKELAGYLDTVVKADVKDLAQYAQLARDGAGLFAAWSVAAGKEGDENAKALGDASDLFARHAQLSDQPKRAVHPPSRLYADLCTHMAISKSRRAGAVAMVKAWSRAGKELGRSFEAIGVARASHHLSTELQKRLDGVHDSYRLSNPLPVKSPAQVGRTPGDSSQKKVESRSTVVAVVDRPEQASTPVVRPLTQAARMEATVAKLRSQGVAEEAIDAIRFAESQQKFSPGARGPAGTPPGAQKVARNDPPRKGRGPDKGVSR